MRGRLLSWPVAALLITLGASAQQQFPALEKGFRADKFYQFGGLDSVNVFSGALMINLPIGPDYALDGGLSYGLRLSFNSKIWSFSPFDDGTIVASPDPRSSAGLGWILGMGRFIPDLAPTNTQQVEIYESPDGGDHPFRPILPPGTGCPSPCMIFPKYTDDGTNLRLRNPAPDVREIDFPDGVIKKFVKNGSGAWELREIRSARSSDVVLIAYGTGAIAGCPAGTNSSWTINDTKARSHLVCFTNLLVDTISRPMVNQVVLSRQPQGRPLVYQFVYQAVENLPKPSEDTNTTPAWRQTHDVQVLDTLILPDQSAYEFDLVTDGLVAMTLPTKGKITYQYENWNVPSRDMCDSTYHPGVGLGGFARGVAQRTFKPAVPAGQTTVSHTWQYARALKTSSGAPGSSYLSVRLCDLQTTPNLPPTPTPIQLYDELVVTITDPLGHKVASHFSVWPGDDTGRIPDPETSPSGFKSVHYGFPHGRYDPGQNRYLSQETFDCTGACALKRTSWVRHDPTQVSHDLAPDPLAFKLGSQSTVFHDDPVGCVPEGLQATCGISFSDSSDWDKYGHYRQVVSNVRFDNRTDVRTVTTAWNKAAGVARTFAANAPWVLNTYESSTTTEGGVTTAEQACFDLDTGLLLGSRKLAGTTPAGKDLAVLYEYVSGNRTAEKYYGGDVAPLDSDATTLCSALGTIAAMTPAYRVNHEWQNAQLARSKEQGLDFFSRDLTVDVDGLVTSSRDTSGVQTNFGYDAIWRLTSGASPGRAETTYAYSNAGGTPASFVPPTVVETSWAGSVELVKREYQYDSFGRLWRQKQLMPGGQWTLRETLFDKMDRTASASEAVSLQGVTNEWSFVPPYKTTFAYDLFGRPTLATAADGKTTSTSYQGSRRTTRTSTVAGAGGTEMTVVRTEEQDAQGRLLAVTESSGPTTAAAPAGGSVITRYGYDPGNRLTSVTMTGAEGVVQNRTFDYDGRGFLRWESHPEGGMTSYTYDTRGNALTKHQGAASSLFDLTYAYDVAGRVVEVRGRNPHFNPATPNDPDQPPFRLMKTFSYGTDNIAGDLRRGKLLTAVRYNYDPVNAEGDTYKVTETYTYGDVAGRKTKRRTTITKGYGANEAFWSLVRTVDTSVAYDELDLPSVMEYPMCVGCGSTPVHPARNQGFTYARGRLTSATGFASGITYWPNGMWNVLSRSNGMTDTQVADPTGMARPAAISSALSDACTIPVITGDPVGGSITAGTPSVTLSVAVTGTAPFSYQWWNDAGIMVGTGPSYVASPTTTTSYWVMVTNACKSVQSVRATVSVGQCLAPGGTASAALNANGTYTLEVLATGTEPRTYTWRRTSDQVLMGTGRKVTVGPLTATTTYTVTIANGCAGSPATANVTVNVATPMTVNTLTALRTGSLNQIQVTWTGATSGVAYVLERRNSAAGWTALPALTPAQLTAMSYVDNNVVAGQTYAYRLRTPATTQFPSAYSNSDVATTTTFPAVSAGVIVTASAFNTMLTAVNSVRAAVGWPAVTWSNILSAKDPLPTPGGVVMSTHITSARARMNEALQALGVTVSGFTDAELRGQAIKDTHINEIMGRAY